MPVLGDPFKNFQNERKGSMPTRCPHNASTIIQLVESLYNHALS